MTTTKKSIDDCFKELQSNCLNGGLATLRNSEHGNFAIIKIEGKDCDGFISSILDAISDETCCEEVTMDAFKLVESGYAMEIKASYFDDEEERSSDTFYLKLSTIY